MNIADISKYGLLKKATLLRNQLRGPLRVLPFGDSITQSNSAQDPTYLTWQLGTAYPEQACFTAGPRFQVIGNAGIGGNTTTQMLARIQTDVLAHKPDIVLFMAGTNDLLTGAGNAGLVTQMNNIEKMVEMMLANNILPIIMTPPAKSSSVTGFVETRNAIRFYYLLAQHYGLPFVDTYKLTTDPTTGNYITNYSADGVHPQFQAIRLIAAAVANVLQNLTSTMPYAYLATYSNTAVEGANLFTNGSFCIQTVANTPDGWGPQGSSITASTVSAQPLVGKTLSITHAASAGYLVLGQTPIPQSGNYSTGDTLVFSGFVGATGLPENGSSTGYTAGITFNGVNNNVNPINSMTMNGNWTFSQEIIVPAGAGSITPYAYAPDAGVYTLSSWTLWNKTATQAVWQPGLQ